MNLRRLSCVLLTLALLVFLTAPALAYSIDGNLTDWGVGVTTGGSWAHESTWVPSAGTSDWIVEDNIDIQRGTDYFPGSWKGEDETDWTSYTATGIHLQGTGSSSLDYDEPLLPEHEETGNDGNKHPIYEQPAGGELMDIEALYYDDGGGISTNVYFALVTSMNPNGWYHPQAGRWVYPGDLALDLDKDPDTGEYGYEYGIVLTDHGVFSQGDIVHNPDWTSTTDFSSSNPYRINGGTKASQSANVAYTNIHIASDNGVGNWVIEIEAPRDALGEGWLGNVDLHATISCGNDLIELEHFTTSESETEIPEFTTIAVPVCMILGLFYFFRRKRQTE